MVSGSNNNKTTSTPTRSERSLTITTPDGDPACDDA